MTCPTCRGKGETPGRTSSGRITCASCLGTGKVCARPATHASVYDPHHRCDP